jgi:hypothetical protein
MSWGAVLFGALGVILFGGSVLLFYEAYATWTGKDPTISKIVAYHFATHPELCFLTVFLVGAVLGGLLVHFTQWKSA